MAIDAIGAGTTRLDSISSVPARTSTGGGAVEGMGESFSKMLDAANTADESANTAVGRMLDGTGDVHEAMIALQQADLMLQFTVQVRNKFVQAYQDIMRMPV
jgi:flagellar hook-basal body complex protein FliE